MVRQTITASETRSRISQNDRHLQILAHAGPGLGERNGLRCHVPKESQLLRGAFWNIREPRPTKCCALYERVSMFPSPSLERLSRPSGQSFHLLGLKGGTLRAYLSPKLGQAFH